MAPLDDELRTVLLARAAGVTPAADPMAGIERRARGLRRRRLTASLTGVALAVATAAVGVSTLQPAPRRATPAPFASSTAPAPSNALDPAMPWDYRGEPSARVVLESAAAARWQDAHHVSDARFQLVYGQVYEPSGRAEAVYVAQVGGQASWGLAQDTASGVVLEQDQPLPTGTAALLLALPGDEVDRLLVVTAPGTTATFRHDPAAAPVPVAGTASTIASVPLEGDTSLATVRVLAADGSAVAEVPVPPAPPLTTPTATTPTATTPPVTSQPANVLAWPTRGTVRPELVAPATAAATAALGGRPGESELKVLYGGMDGHGVRYLMGQAWLRGAARAHGFSYALSAGGDPTVFLGAATPDMAELLAFTIALPQSPGSALLVVVPSPRTSQVLYDTDGAGALRPVSGTTADGGVVLLPRTNVDPATESDRLQLLTGNGDPATDTTFDGPVRPLLCASKGCG